MMSVKDSIREDLKNAMKSGDSMTRDTLRMILAAVIHEQTSGKAQSELTDEQYLALLAREAKKRHEAASIYRENNRTDLAEKEQAEAEVIARYLPQQLSDMELSSLIEETITELGLESAPNHKDFGTIMKAVRDKAKGQAAGARISAAIKSIISQE